MVGTKGAYDDHHRRCHLREIHLMDSGGGGDVNGVMESPFAGVSCSICLELVQSDASVRSRAKLQCGHEFHLDCIGSAFNMKGAMQCPNCRKVERGQWLYASGSNRSLPELSMEDWIPDEDFYDLSYPEMPYRFQWCPFGELTRTGSSFEELESPSTTYHDPRGHHALFSQAAAAASLASSYVAYVGQLPPPTTRSNDSVDDSSFNHQWNGVSGHSDTVNPHTFPAINIQYQSWGLHSPPFSINSNHINGAEPAPVPPVTLRPSHGDNDALVQVGYYPYAPFVIDYLSGDPRAGSSFVSSVAPGGGAQIHDMMPVSYSIHHHQQQPPSNAPVMPSPIMPSIRRGMTSVVAPPPPHHLQPEFYVISQNSSTENMHFAETHVPNRYHASWGREQASQFQVPSRDYSGWEHSQHHHATSSSDSLNRGSSSSSFWHRHSSS